MQQFKGRGAIYLISAVIQQRVYTILHMKMNPCPEFFQANY
jgi:hypothetical protein